MNLNYVSLLHRSTVRRARFRVVPLSGFNTVKTSLAGKRVTGGYADAKQIR